MPAGKEPCAAKVMKAVKASRFQDLYVSRCFFCKAICGHNLYGTVQHMCLIISGSPYFTICAS